MSATKCYLCQKEPKDELGVAVVGVVVAKRRNDHGLGGQIEGPLVLAGGHTECGPPPHRVKAKDGSRDDRGDVETGQQGGTAGRESPRLVVPRARQLDQGVTRDEKHRDTTEKVDDGPSAPVVLLIIVEREQLIHVLSRFLPVCEWPHDPDDVVELDTFCIVRALILFAKVLKGILDLLDVGVPGDVNPSDHHRADKCGSCGDRNEAFSTRAFSLHGGLQAFHSMHLHFTFTNILLQ